MKTTLLGLALAGLSLSLHAADNKVLLIGIDGLQYEKLAGVDTPAFDRLNITKAYTGGIAGTSTEQLTKSGPGWATILTGMWVDRHQVTNNDSGLANSDVKSVYRYIAEANPQADISSFSTWAPIHTQFFSNDLELMTRYTSGGTDDSNLQQTLTTLSSQDPDFIFLHLDEPDEVGHSQCFGSAYNASIKAADQRLGQLLDAVEQREQQGEDWLVLVTTDHGRTPVTGCGHGNQTSQEKTIFIATNQSLNTEFSQVTQNPVNTDFGGLYGYAAQTAITPTIVRFLAADTGTQTDFASTPMVGEPGVRKLMYYNGAFSWVNGSSAEVEVYRNNTLVDTLNNGETQWQDPAAPQGINHYRFMQNDVSVSYQISQLDLTAAHQWHNAKSYFFGQSGRYWRYDTVLDKTDSGYPTPVTDYNWPGLADYKQLIDAAFYKDANTVYYFLSDGRYLSYDVQADRVRDGYPKAVSDNDWPGLAPYADRIQAALKWQGERVYFFLRDGTYLRYNLSENRVDSGYPKPVNDSTWPGLGAYAGKITAALKWNDARAYFFVEGNQYLRYSISADQVDAGYPKPINSSTWPGLQ
ncbi:hemopexin repeat-containing protein [Vibrio proteolyticus]|uniref:Metalloenzyme domain-containing protein n=1 Tax=Vibrio proteolyticus NBRC 13287 TaxID=1219065 RepID=U3BH03_VIBPR|nr:hemopexin repeat-containing protein [Vibrio proteolyticus]GAD65978.1 hypothetical protein VPR01S_02_02290 [Vibrio proteolyticus NBRC 13287]